MEPPHVFSIDYSPIFHTKLHSKHNKATLEKPCNYDLNYQAYPPHSSRFCLMCMRIHCTRLSDVP